MPFGTGPSCLAQSRTSSLGTRTSHPPSYGHLLQALPPPYTREEVYNSEANHFRQHLVDVNAECSTLKQCIQDIDGEPLLCPDGFEDNNGRLPLLTIPNANGESPAIFIKQLDNG